MAAATYPEINKPDHEKDKKWHKSMAEAILANGVWGFPALAKAAEYYMGMIDQDADHYHLVMSEGQQLLPLDMIPHKSLKKYVSRLEGDLIEMGIKPSVRANSKNALSRRRDAELEMTTDYKLMPLMRLEEQMTGMPVAREGMANTPEELEQNKKSYKENGEEVYQRILNDFMKKARYDRLRLLFYRDYLVKGSCWCWNESIGSDVKPHRLDPEEVIWDSGVKDNFCTDASFIGFGKYEPIHVAKSRYGISNEEMKRLEGQRKSPVFLSGENYSMWKQINSEWHILVTHIFWKDTQEKVGITRTTKAGVDLYNVTDKELDPKLPSNVRDDHNRRMKQAKEKKPVPVEIVRKHVMVGNETMDWGIVPNMVRTDDDWQKTGFPIKGVMAEYYSGLYSSMVMDVIGLEMLRNEAWHKLRQAFKRDKGMLLIYDTAQQPTNYELQDIEYYEQVYGKVLINTKSIGGPNSTYNQYRGTDTSLKVDNAMAYIQIIKALDEDIEKITGVSNARMGDLASPSVKVGVHQATIVNSNLTTRGRLFIFEKFEEELLEHIIGHRKIFLLQDPERMKHIIGDEGYEFVLKDIGFQADDYSIYVSTSTGLTADEMQTIRDTTKFVVQNGGVEFVSGMKVLLEKDPKEALIELERVRNERREEEKEMQKQQAAQQQAAMQQDMQKTQMEQQGKFGIEQMKSQTSLSIADKQLESDREKNRTDLFRERIKAMNNRVVASV